MDTKTILAILAVAFMLIETFKVFLAGPAWVKSTNWMTFSFAMVLLIMYF